MKAMYATATTSVTMPGGIMVVVPEGSHWSADDPIVRNHPDLFSEDPRYGMLFSRPLREGDYPGGEVPVVETATAVPGDRRNVGQRRA